MALERWTAFVPASVVPLAVPGPTARLVSGQPPGAGRRRNAPPLLAATRRGAGTGAAAA